MPNERVSMSKLKQLIALQASNLSVRAIARALGLSVGAISNLECAQRGAEEQGRQQQQTEREDQRDRQ